jgi:ABC-type phosphate transport system permease subunit
MKDKNYFLAEAEKRRKRRDMEELKDKCYEWIIMSLVVLVVVMFLGWVWMLSLPGAKEYNAHVCAVYGYEEDYKTKLGE